MYLDLWMLDADRCTPILLSTNRDEDQSCMSPKLFIELHRHYTVFNVTEATVQVCSSP